MNFDFATSRVDCIKKKILLLFQYVKKIHLDHLKHPPIHPLFSARKILRARSTLMHLVYVNKKILFFRIFKFDNTLIILPWTVLNS